MDQKLPASPECSIIRIQETGIRSRLSGHRHHTGDSPPGKEREQHTSGDSAPDSVLDILRKLAELRDSGVITEEEFTQKKTELLKRL